MTSYISSPDSCKISDINLNSEEATSHCHSQQREHCWGLPGTAQDQDESKALSRPSAQWGWGLQFSYTAPPGAWLQPRRGFLLLENQVGSHPSSPRFSASQSKWSIVSVQRGSEGHCRCCTRTPGCTCFSLCPNGAFHHAGDYPHPRKHE